MPDSDQATNPVNIHSLRFNGEPLPMPHPLNLSELLAAHNIEAAAVATAVNGQFVQREQRTEMALHDGDEVITFQAVVGG